MCRLEAGCRNQVVKVRCTNRLSSARLAFYVLVIASFPFLRTEPLKVVKVKKRSCKVQHVQARSALDCHHFLPSESHLADAPAGHPLPEVRSRSLRSLKLKLEHGLLVLNDVVEEEYMLRQLLEWFNKEGCQQEEEVLGLLTQLSQVKN